MKRKIRTAVIGVGNMGKHHVRIYSQISHLVAISDVIPELGRTIAHQYNVVYYKDYRQMLDEVKPDAVSVAVPTSYHREIVVGCLQRKIPTLVEKPIALTIPDGITMIDASRKYRTSLMVGHIERFNPVIIKLKELIDSRKFGDIINLLVMRVGISPPEIKDADVSLELAIHDIDIFNLLLGELPYNKHILKKKVYKNSIADSSTITLEYPKATALVYTNWITPIKMRKLYVTGTKGFAEIDYITQKLILYKRLIQKKHYDDFTALTNETNLPNKKIYVSKKEPLKEELHYFLRCVIHKKQNDATHALEALRVLLV